MRISSSLLQDLLQALPHLHQEKYFKSSLMALSHAMEDLVLVGGDQPLVIANFQHERFYRQEISRYQQIAQRTDHVYVMAAPESEFAALTEPLATIPFDPSDDLALEWHLVVVGKQYTACLICRECSILDAPTVIDQARQFEGIWSFDRQVSVTAARLLLERIAVYRPELDPQVRQAWQRYGLEVEKNAVETPTLQAIDSVTFAQRLVSYLQANQYRLLKAYQLIATSERKERLVNSMTAAIRRSLNPQEILTIAVIELGRAFDNCRCLLYRCDRKSENAAIEYETVAPGIPSVGGETWSLIDNPLFQAAIAQDKAIAVADVSKAPHLQSHSVLKPLIERLGIRSWLLVPVLYQETLLGMLEVHYSGAKPHIWLKDDISLVEAIADAIGVALIQAQAYTRLEELNCQLEALERTRSNLIAIVGHELRTPLSTIQVCLETLASEPEMSKELQQSMLQTALTDSERLRQLTQDFLTLSRLESGQVRWQREPISLQECLDLALSSLRSYWSPKTLAQIKVNLPPKLPLLLADGQGLVEVLTKLLDNACKFTDSKGKISIRAQKRKAKALRDEFVSSSPMTVVEVIIADTGRGIEPNQLEAIFDRFSQEEGYLRRLTGGAGLGLAICRRIILGLGGQIWAESKGKNQGSQFHFTVPIEPIVLCGA
ncbi:histidine kinase [Scytonema hofmannii PCC 7110]|uniref:histidine kinase n=1 Tax=Scytonema hofmannii PCC 7110 TaxID=128403 RepID=A0A139XDL1_9CYAN|nr:DICT sensory domain-containing protein [Scytonema hofmannii]KYC42791.1 histidine kinase [Scytonema hofmannii PCC 7110]